MKCLEPQLDRNRLYALNSFATNALFRVHIVHGEYTCDETPFIQQITALALHRASDYCE